MANVKMNGTVLVKAASVRKTNELEQLLFGMPEELPSHAMVEGTVARVMSVHDDGDIAVAPPKGSVLDGGNKYVQILSPGEFEVIEEGDGDFRAAFITVHQENYDQTAEILGFKVGDKFTLDKMPEEASDDFPLEVGGTYEIEAMDDEDAMFIIADGHAAGLTPELLPYISKL